MSEQKPRDGFLAEIRSQVTKIKELLDVDFLELGYHFQIQIDPDWSNILPKCAERAQTLGYGNDLKYDMFIPLYERVRITGTQLNHLYDGGFMARVEIQPFVEFGAKTLAREIKYEICDKMNLNVSFGLAREGEIPKPALSLKNMVAEAFRTPEKDLSLCLHRPDSFNPEWVLSIGKLKDGNINDRLDLNGPINLYSLLRRVYLAAIGREPLICTEERGNGDRIFESLPDVADGFDVRLDGELTEFLCSIPASIPGSWVGFNSDYCKIGVKIDPINI